MTRQIGPLVSAEWRHRLVNGSYSIRAAGIFQQDKEAFLDNGLTTPGYRDFRGSIETAGQFRINDRWNWGWDAALFTDRFFSNDYSMANQSVGSEKTSQVYLTGQGERSYFDARVMYFTGFSRLDNSGEMPVIHPIIDHSYVLDQPVLGGELGFRTNFVSLSRRDADFDPTIPVAATDTTTCITAVNPGNCLMRGMAGDYTRFSTEMHWRRTITNPWGMVIKPFATARLDVATRDSDGGANSNQFIESGRDNMARAMPAMGMEVRWPFISVHSWGTQIVEPIAQVVARPNESHIGRFPNEDAQSLVFDDTNLFAIDKYSGYDRVEGGTRANLGVQYTANIHRYGMVNMLFGQSYHLAGRNSYAYTDATNTGAESGLEHDVSDYVSRIYYQPVGNISYAARARFDKDNFDVRRLELEARSTWDQLSLSTIYARYDAQPQIGYTEKREGIYQTAALKFHENWTVFGGARYDLGRSEFDLAVVGLNYVDECFAATFSYVADYSNLTYTKPVHRIMLRMNLRTLGGTGFSTQVGSERTGP
jgi:LPS-assembly protein